MVKKISQSTPAISKNEKMQLNCLVKALKPKVYITDTSNFKRLVQELTGNVSKQPEEPPVKQGPIIDLQATVSMEAAVSMDASLDSSEWPEEQLVETNYNNIKYVDDVFLDVSSMNQQRDDLFQYQDLDQSWLFDPAEQPSLGFCNGYAQHIEQEVTIYDYGYSG